ncbi:CBU_0592 family membrane protein [Curtobacterium sp. L1-20]|uniref:CBU_0592 family membrane protein n=1 Tax=Curtobacterium sp. L1-20 TaxID=3138181 RepID=UPI003B529DAB
MLYGIVEFLGWFGAVTVLAGYILFSTGRLPNGPLYQLFNLVGGLAVAINVAAHHAIPSTIVNGIWAVVAVVVLVRMGRARRAARRGVPAAEPSVLHAEPAATTAVLPVIGPALRDHEAGERADGGADTRLPAETAPMTDGAATHASSETHAAEAPTAAAPMTESLPVITATIALALVAAAQERVDQQHADERHADQQAEPAEQHAEHAEQHEDPADGTETLHAVRPTHAAPSEPERADSATA